VTKFNMQHLIDFLRALPDDVSVKRMFDLAAERWPGVTVAQLHEASVIIAQEYRDESKRLAREMLRLKKYWK